MLLIKSGLIYTMAEKSIFTGDILIKDGKIEKIAEKIDKTDKMKLIDAEGLIVTPGFIDAHTHLGMNEDSIGAVGVDSNEASDPATPDVRAIDAVNPLDRTFEEAREAGITSVMVTPGSANPIGGLASAIKTHGDIVDDMIIKEDLAMKVAFGENPKRVYGGRKQRPSGRMGTAAVIREYLTRTKIYIEEKENGNNPNYDFKLEALIPVIKKEIPLKAHAHRTDDILTALRIANEFDVDITLDHCSAGHLIVDRLVAENRPAIVGPTLMHRTKYESIDKTFATPGILADAGIKVAITTDSPVVPLNFLPISAGMAIKKGMDELDAFKAITINPAEIMGLEDRIGSIEEGKDADLVIFDGHPLIELTSQTKYTIIDGKIVYEDK